MAPNTSALHPSQEPPRHPPSGLAQGPRSPRGAQRLSGVRGLYRLKPSVCKDRVSRPLDSSNKASFSLESRSSLPGCVCVRTSVVRAEGPPAPAGDAEREEPVPTTGAPPHRQTGGVGAQGTPPCPTARPACCKKIKDPAGPTSDPAQSDKDNQLFVKLKKWMHNLQQSIPN